MYVNEEFFLYIYIKVIQRRFNGSENFFRSFADYAAGFGNKTGEYWAGIKDYSERPHISQGEKVKYSTYRGYV